MFLKKLTVADDRYREIEQMLTLPEVVSDNKRYSSLIKEYNSLTSIVEKYREYISVQQQMNDSDEMMRDSSLDSDLRELAEEEFKEKRSLLEDLTEELKVLLMPRDPNDDKNVIVEIRQGAGGEEAEENYCHLSFFIAVGCPFLYLRIFALCVRYQQDLQKRYKMQGCRLSCRSFRSLVSAPSRSYSDSGSDL